ncbi:MAG: molybdenum cofactor biosynthesis protein MoaE, partial [Candidatus Baltobacteraceae bacterium]
MFEITGARIDPSALAERVRSDEHGAVVLFTGVVRRLSDELEPVNGLHYEAHASMAAAEFERIAGEARERFGPCTIAAVHRTGDLTIGEVAVAVAAASAHRAQAFDACEYAIDQIKARAPIWKKEHYAGGQSS